MAVSPHHPALHHPTGNDAATSAAIALLIHYFDLAPASAQLLVKKWLVNYPALWIRAAVTEALYQGRYKPFSVEQILAFWQRRGKAISHFNKEFETIIAVPLKGVIPSETAEEVTATNGQPSLDLESLAVGLSSAEQAQAESESSPVPRPRLMLPGELPGTSLAQQSPAPLEHPEANGSPSARALPRSLESAASAQPKGFDGIIDPRPRPQVTQGPDSAIVAETKAKPIQPPPIGPFTPAADPSGFSSRLKAVVEQALAKQASNNGAAQPPAEAEPSSLRDAIQTQIEQLQAASSHSEEATEAAIDFKDAPALASSPEAVDRDNTTTDIEPVITPVPLVSASQPELQDADQPAVQDTEPAATASPNAPSPQSFVDAKPIASEEPDPWETENVTSSPEPALEGEPASTGDGSLELTAIAISAPPDTQATDELPEDLPLTELSAPNIADESQQADLEPELELPAAFEARFPLTTPQATDAESPREKDEMDLALDQRLGEVSPSLWSEHSSGPSLGLSHEASIEAPDTTNSSAVDPLNHQASGKLLDGDALHRHLEADFDQAEAYLQEGELTQNEVLKSKQSLEERPSQMLDASLDATAQEQASRTEALNPEIQHEAAQPSNSPNETVLEISQVSNLMASLNPPQPTNQPDNFSLADLASLEVPLTSPSPTDIEEQDELA